MTAIEEGSVTNISSEDSYSEIKISEIGELDKYYIKIQIKEIINCEENEGIHKNLS